VVKRLLKSEKGASSILVILLLVVLVVFGVAALTTALSGMRLAQKVADWNTRYYQAEAAAWECCAEIDSALQAVQPGPDTDAAAAKQALTTLSFDTQVETADNGLRISYQVYSDDGTVGIHTTLAMSFSDGSLSVVQWQEFQQEGLA
jgi:Tfp pilus assembly protein PilX